MSSLFSHLCPSEQGDRVHRQKRRVSWLRSATSSSASPGPPCWTSLLSGITASLFRGDKKCFCVWCMCVQMDIGSIPRPVSTSRMALNVKCELRTWNGSHKHKKWCRRGMLALGFSSVTLSGVFAVIGQQQGRFTREMFWLRCCNVFLTLSKSVRMFSNRGYCLSASRRCHFLSTWVAADSSSLFHWLVACLSQQMRHEEATVSLVVSDCVSFLVEKNKTR